MGLIMLILIGTVPTASALNRALPESHTAAFEKVSNAAPMDEATYPSRAALVRDISDQVKNYGSLSKVPAEVVGNTRNDMYLVSEALRFLAKDKENDLSEQDLQTLAAYKPVAPLTAWLVDPIW